jgi:hypothetical protein
MVEIKHFEMSTPSIAALALDGGSVIRLISGRLWLTVQGQSDDVWLTASGNFTLSARGTVWISAEPAAQFQVAQRVAHWRGPALQALKALGST